MGAYAMPRLVDRTCRSGLALFVAFVGIVAGSATLAEGVRPIPPSRLTAVYDLRFRGFSLGDMKFRSKLQKGRYDMDVKVSVQLLGGLIYTWDGVATSSGSYRGATPTPKNFSFSYRSPRKKVRQEMSFAGTRVKSVSRTPAKPPSPRNVPLTEDHKRGVFDPMTALIVMSHAKRAGARQACERKVPVFDGRHRFDIVLSYKRTKRLRRNGGRGYSGTAVICRVSFEPIAGHRPNERTTHYMTRNKGIELWLIPAPSFKMYVPYYLKLPTPYGLATATSSNIQIETPGGARLALVR